MNRFPPSRVSRPAAGIALVAVVACLLGAGARAAPDADVAPPPSPASAVPTDTDTWPVVGRQGVVRFVLVPVADASNHPAYRRQIDRLCDPERTCFLNFYTNSTGAPATLPLPEAIAAEATATFRRSMKNGVERLLWSCRLKLPVDECF